jgi:predicted nucleic acid-binding protein
MVSPDFLIGAHAAAEGWPVLTRDRRRLDACFGSLEIVSPIRAQPQRRPRGRGDASSAVTSQKVNG